MEITLKDIKKIWVTGEAVHLLLNDGRTAKELFSNYPRLRDATEVQRGITPLQLLAFIGPILMKT